MSFIDIGLYASAKMGNHLIWTNDRNLKNLCESKNIFFKDKDELKKYIIKNQLKNKYILLKASRGIGLESIKDIL